MDPMGNGCSLGLFHPTSNDRPPWPLPHRTGKFQAFGYTRGHASGEMNNAPTCHLGTCRTAVKLPRKIYHTKRKVGRFPFPPWLSGAFAEKNFGGVVGWFVS